MAIIYYFIFWYANFTVIIFNNTCCHLMSVNCIYAFVNMTEIQITNNTLSSQYNSLLYFYNYTTLVANFNEVRKV